MVASKSSQTKAQAKNRIIAPWKVLLLSIVTLGIYVFIWASRRYREKAETASFMSHWLVPLGIYVGATILLITTWVFLLILSSFITSDTASVGTIAVYGGYALLGLAHVFATWWLVYHVLHLPKVSINLLAAILIAFFFSPLLVWYAQRQLNNQRGTTFGLLAVTICAVVIGLASNVAAFSLDPPANLVKEFDTDFKSMQTSTEEYTACHERLEVQYPGETIDEDKYEAYIAGFETCEKILE